ncbi:unnamed protein product, partial [Iphiclides podalirius]
MNNAVVSCNCGLRTYVECDRNRKQTRSECIRSERHLRGTAKNVAAVKQPVRLRAVCSERLIQAKTDAKRKTIGSLFKRADAERTKRIEGQPAFGRPREDPIVFPGRGLSVVYCVITWTCPRRRDGRNLGRNGRYVASERILRSSRAPAEKTPRRPEPE